MSRRASIFSADKEHIHHKLLDLGLDERKILTIIYGFSIYLSVVAVTTVILPKETNVYIILIVWVGSMLGYYSLDILKSRQGKKNKKEDINIKQNKSGA